MGAMLAARRQTTVTPAVKLLTDKHLTPVPALRSLGSLGLTLEGTVLLGGRRKLLLLLSYLALRGGRPIGRTELAAMFWEESDEGRSRQSLRQALLKLRETLGEALVVTDGAVSLSPGSVDLDVARFESLADSGALIEAESLWGGEFLAGVELYAGEQLRAWLEPWRERLRRRRAWVGETLVREAVDRGAWADALLHAERWSAALPADEAARERLAALRQLSSRRREPSPGGVALLTPDLVGREAGFALLTSLWEQMTASIPGLVLIEGEDGTGKSRLLEEFLRWVRLRSPLGIVVAIRAYEAEQDRPLVLARHLLAPMALAPGVSAAPPSALRAVAGVAPEFAERFPALPPEEPDHLPEAIARVLAEVAAERRVLLAVDDAHLADPVSRDLLEGLYRRPVPGVLLVLTAPPGPISLTDLERRPVTSGQLHRLRLGNLDRENLERLLASMAEFRAPDRAALAARLMEETAGNPLAVVELVTALADQAMIAPAADGSWIADLPASGVPLPLPTTLRETMANRLRRLSPEALRVLQASAVLARDATLGLVHDASGCTTEQFEAALDELVSRRLLRLPPDGTDHLDFTHEALRRAVYEMLPPMRQRELHARARDGLLRAPARDSAALAALTYHEARAGRRRIAASRFLAGAGVLVVALFVSLLLLRGGARAPRAMVLAVPPFTSAGDSLSSELGQAAAEAVGLALERGTGIGVIPPDAMPSPGGGPSVTGSVTRTSNGLRLQAALREAGNSGRVLATATTDGAVDELPGLAARLAARLLPGRFGEAPFALSSARSVSVPALRSYFRGLRLSRQLQMEAAAQEFWRATRSDPAMAAAWHGLARVNAWFLLTDRSRRMADSALAHAGGLLPHDRMLLSGWQLFASGQPDEAEAQFRQVLGFSQDNIEANVGLAEVLYHHNWSRGRETGESRPFWDAAARADPTDWRPLVHRWELAAREGRWKDAASLLRRALVVGHDSGQAERLLLTQLEGDSLDLPHRIATLEGRDEWAIAQLAVSEAVIMGRLDVSRDCLERLTEAGHSDEVRAFAYEQLAYLALALGRWRDAMKELRLAGALDPVSAETVEAAMWAAPFLPSALTDSGRAGARSRVQQTRSEPARRTFLFWFDFDRGREKILRPYLVRLLNLEAGLPAPGDHAPLRAGGGIPDSLAALQPFLDGSLEAWEALRQRDTVRALEQLRTAWDGVEAEESELSAFSARPWDHYLKASLLEGQGRWEEAARWFKTAGRLSIPTLAYRAPACLHRGRLMERIGRKAEALDEYRELVRLWAGADPEFLPWVGEARARIASLDGGS